MRRIGSANGMLGVDLDVQVQAVVDQQNRRGVRRISLVTHELLGVGQKCCLTAFEGNNQSAFDNAVAGRIDVRTFFQGHRAVQHITGVFNDFGTTFLVVAWSFGAAIGF